MLQNEIKLIELLVYFLCSFGHWESSCKPSRQSWSSFPCVYCRHVSLPLADWNQTPSSHCNLLAYQNNPNNQKPQPTKKPPPPQQQTNHRNKQTNKLTNHPIYNLENSHISTLQRCIILANMAISESSWNMGWKDKRRCRFKTVLWI